MTEFTNEDLFCWLVIGISFFVVGLLVANTSLFFDADDGEIEFNGERFVRVDAEQEDVEELYDLICEEEEDTKGWWRSGWKDECQFRRRC